MAETEVMHPAGAPVLVDIEFHGITYAVCITVHADVLVVEIEDRDSFNKWRGEFTSKYVEDITSKTGNFKKFAIFVRMLQSAVLQQSDSVYIDLLTYQDLEILKAKKQSNASSAGAQQQLPASTKRYLILTYASEFDRVHYPLPLLQEDPPDAQHLISVIQQLRQQLQQLQQKQQQMPLPLSKKAQAAGAVRAQQLNNGASLALPGPLSSQGPDGSDAAVLASRLEVAQAELDRERAAHRRELRRKARELQELQEELSRSRDTTRDLRLRVKALEQELEAVRRLRETAAAAAAAAAAAHRGSSNPYRQGTGDRWPRVSSSYLSGSGKYPSRPARSNANAGSSSRGSSPASSRAQSPGYSRPWAPGPPSSPKPPRPNSAPPKQRFNPTEYVKQKRQREQQLAAARGGGSRGGSPARPACYSSSGDRSGSSSPMGLASGLAPQGTGAGRSSSRERMRLGSYDGSSLTDDEGRSGSRQGSAERRKGSSGCNSISAGHSYLRATGSSSNVGGGSGSSSRPGSTGRQRPGSSGSGSSRRDTLGRAYGVDHRGADRLPGSSSGTAYQRPAGSLDRQHSAGRDGTRASASPGRALQGVQEKLSAFMAKQQQQQQQQQLDLQKQQHLLPGAAHVTANGAAAPAEDCVDRSRTLPAAAAAAAELARGEGGVFQDASSEIADIDQRLQALQNFLKMAKSSAAASQQ